MKQTLLFLLLVLSVNNSFAQGNISFGLTSTNYKIKSNNNQNFDDYQDADVGFFVKVSGTVPLGNVLYIEPGIGFNTSNTKENKGPGIKSMDIFLPIDIGAKIGKYVRINTGVQANFLLKAKATQFNIEKDIKEEYKDSYADILAGITLKPTEKIGIIFRYNHSLSSVFENNYAIDADFRKTVLSLGLKITFN